jgi:ABC-type branched-subunit amino acid transport system ATPase component
LSTAGSSVADAASAATPLLLAHELTMRFGGLTAVDRVSLDLGHREVLAVIGPNGSGKSTLLNLLSGIYPGQGGRIELAGRRLGRRAPSAVTRAGIARTFQNLQLFDGLSVLDNVLVGMHGRLRGGVLGAVVGSRRVRGEERQARDRGLELLERVGLAGTADHLPASLSYGQRRLLEVARALASEPRVLMLDEPTAGLSAAEDAALARLVRGLAEAGTSVLLVEHNMRFVMGLVDRILVLNFGRRIAVGRPAEIRADEAVIDAYLGRSGHADR